jgi:hypothetical protein
MMKRRISAMVWSWLNIPLILVPSSNLIYNAVVGTFGVKGTSLRAAIISKKPLSERTSFGTYE